MKLSTLLLTASAIHAKANNLRNGIASDVVALADGPVKSRPEASTTNSLRNNGEEQFGSLIPDCLDTITRSANVLLGPIEEFIQSLDPIEVGDEIGFTVDEFELPGGVCTASTTFEADLGDITGLSLTDISVSLVDGECSLWEGTFEGTWRLTKTLTTLVAAGGVKVESEACGHPIDLSVDVSASIPSAVFSVDISLGGSVGLFPLSLNIGTAELTNVVVDVESIMLNLEADSPLGEFVTEENIDDFISEELEESLSAFFESTVSDGIGEFLPIVYPSPDYPSPDTTERLKLKKGKGSGKKGSKEPGDKKGGKVLRWSHKGPGDKKGDKKGNKKGYKKGNKKGAPPLP